MAVTRQQLQNVARCRIEDAKVLVRRKRRDAACHPAGYAVERALKSCMIRRAVRPDEWFPAPDFSRRCFTNDLETLCILANLDPEIDGGARLLTNWTAFKDGNEDRRYEITKTEVESKVFLQAIIDGKNRALAWLQKCW
jgi:hypothetical protein